MSKTTLVCFMISTLFLLSFSLSGGILETYTYGEINYTSSARYLGMGETFIAGDLTANPASYADLKRMFLSLGFGASMQSERRSKKAFDSFDNTIGDVTVSDNSFLYPTLTPFVLAYPFELLNVALQLTPWHGFEYRYKRVVRDEYYVKIEDISEECIGNVWAYSGILAKEFGKFSTGMRVDYIDGRIRHKKKEDYVDPEMNSYHINYTIDWTGWDFILGVTLDISWRMRIAAFYDIGAKIDRLGLYPDIDYPTTLGFGIRYKPANVLPATLSMDILYTQWENLKEPGPIPCDPINHVLSLYNTTSYRLGVEHLFSPETKLRFGFAYTPSYIDKSIATAEFTLGGGFLVSGFEIDLGAGITRRVFKGSDVPIDLESGIQVDIEDELSFEELGIKILTTITKHF